MCTTSDTPKTCRLCGDEYFALAAKTCSNCTLLNILYLKYGTGQIEAQKKVARLIKRGDMPPAKECACVDCGKPARDYDHRDYNKPLEVVPVCRSCNQKRGYATPLQMTFDEFVEKVRWLPRYGHVTAQHFMPINYKYWPEDFAARYPEEYAEMTNAATHSQAAEPTKAPERPPLSEREEYLIQVAMERFSEALSRRPSGNKR